MANQNTTTEWWDTLRPSYRGDPEILARQDCEDMINRMAVSLICPDLHTVPRQPKSGHKAPRDKVIDKLCEEMLANLGRKITLSELEQKISYTGRALQYAFRSRFGCSPLEWLRAQRLQAARQRILNGDYTSITQLAHTACDGPVLRYNNGPA